MTYRTGTKVPFTIYDDDVFCGSMRTEHIATKLVDAANDRHLAGRVADAFQSLALRLWCDDVPEDRSTIAAIDEWTAGLPEDEAAALNAMLGENFGKGPAWDSDHPISEWVRQDSESTPTGTPDGGT